MKAGQLKKGTVSKGFTGADYAQHIRKLKSRLPAGFSIVIEPPFVVLGDESLAMVKYRARRTVGWAVRKLKARYFKKDPEHILAIWLFKNRRSYRKYTKLLFKDRPDTPFGYYSAHHRALIMNIATGGGTLVHEIVHPFMAANFKKCPSWFNEGMGSLYEQSGQRNGHIVGLTNWRLAGLQQAIQSGSLPSFKYLTGTTEDQFYNKDSGTNYAQARYLCYYLQETGQLANFYHAFVKNHHHDPTGYKTIKNILGVSDMKKFQKQWEAWVLKLRFTG